MLSLTFATCSSIRLILTKEPCFNPIVEAILIRFGTFFALAHLTAAQRHSSSSPGSAIHPFNENFATCLLSQQMDHIGDFYSTPFS